MLRKLDSLPQLDMFKTVLTRFTHSEHELYLLTKKIDWNSLRKEFSP